MHGAITLLIPDLPPATRMYAPPTAAKVDKQEDMCRCSHEATHASPEALPNPTCLYAPPTSPATHVSADTPDVMVILRPSSIFYLSTCKLPATCGASTDTQEVMPLCSREATGVSAREVTVIVCLSCDIEYDRGLGRGVRW